MTGQLTNHVVSFKDSLGLNTCLVPHACVYRGTHFRGVLLKEWGSVQCSYLQLQSGIVSDSIAERLHCVNGVPLHFQNDITGLNTVLQSIKKRCRSERGAEATKFHLAKNKPREELTSIALFQRSVLVVKYGG